MGTAVRWWLPVAVSGTVLCGLIYAVTRQSLIASVSGVHVSSAQETASGILGGKSMSTFDAYPRHDLRTGNMPFTIVFNDARGPSASGVQLDGVIPVPPSSVFSQADAKGEDRFIWEPAGGVRIMAAMLKFDGNGRKGYVVAGTSLAETEARELALLRQVILGWAGMLFTTFVTSLAVSRPKSWFARK